MKPYTITLDANEIGKIAMALRSCKRLAVKVTDKERGVFKHPSVLVDEALAILDKPLEGGYESDEERLEAFYKGLDQDFAGISRD